MEVLSLLRAVLRVHYLSLTKEQVFDMALAAFRVVASTPRTQFLEALADYCVRALPADTLLHAERCTVQCRLPSPARDRLRSACFSLVPMAPRSIAKV